MTPREPDRYDKAALEIWGGDFTPAGFAAALRREREAALDEVRQYVDASPLCSQRSMLRLLDDLASPAAAPAAETGNGTCWSDPQWCAEHGQPLNVCAEQGRAPPSDRLAELERRLETLEGKT